MVISCLASVPGRKYILETFLHFKWNNWFPASEHCEFADSSSPFSTEFSLYRTNCITSLAYTNKTNRKLHWMWTRCCRKLFIEDLCSLLCLNAIPPTDLVFFLPNLWFSNSSLLHEQRLSWASVIFPILTPPLDIPSLHYPHPVCLCSFLDTL